MSTLRLIVVDADLPRRLASELRARGRAASSTAELNLDELKDPPLLRELASRVEGPWVLVTGDDAMPAEHGAVIVETGATIATIHPERPEGVTEHAWRRDVVHRWAHALQTQTSATVRRYRTSGSLVWTPRRRHIRSIAEGGWLSWPNARERQAPSSDPEPDASQQEPLPGL